MGSLGQEEALRYARGTFQNFTKNHMKEIEQLMGLLVFNKHPKDRSPYTSAQGSQWEEVAAEFMKQACGLMGQVLYSDSWIFMLGTIFIAIQTLLMDILWWHQIIGL